VFHSVQLYFTSSEMAEYANSAISLLFWSGSFFRIIVSFSTNGWRTRLFTWGPKLLAISPMSPSEFLKSS